MNLFKTLWLKAKDALKENARELSLKAQYKTYIAKKEENLIISENSLQEKILSNSWSFADLAHDYEDIKLYKEEIELAKEIYEYIFTEKKEETKN